jgi:uncharacterized DUF497 family protein
MEFEWDPIKDAANQAKHGMSFVAATAVFDDPHHLTEDTTKPEYGEERGLAIGMVNGRLTTVVYTDRGDRRRIILARRARNNERERYDQSKASA